jgi:hypothetical protein
MYLQPLHATAMSYSFFSRLWCVRPAPECLTTYESVWPKLQQPYNYVYAKQGTKIHSQFYN